MAGDRGQFRYGFELGEGLPGRNFHYARFQKEAFKAEREYKVDPNLDPSGNETEGEVLKLTGTASVTAAANSESWLAARIHHHGFYDHSSPAAGVELWELRDRDEIEEDAIAFYIDSLHAGIWRDEAVNPAEFRAFGWKVQEFAVNTDANDFVFVTHAGMFLRDRYVADPEEVAVDEDSGGYWIIRGMRAKDDENGDPFKWKVISAGVAGDLDPADLNDLPTIQFGKGADAYPALGVATIPLVANDWLNVLNADGTVAGAPREPLQIMYVADVDTDIVTAGDAWSADARGEKPVPTFSVRPKLNAAACEVRFSRNGGTTWQTRRIEGGFSLKMGRPREAKFGLGSIAAQTIGRPTNARKWWELSFNGTYENLELVQAMISGVAFQAYTKFRGALIGSTGYEDFSEYTLENLRVTEAGAQVQTAGDMPENPTMRAFSKDGSTLCIERHQNTIASVTPT